MNKAYKLSLWILQQDPDNESGLAPRAARVISALHLTFDRRGTHALPTGLSVPPPEWQTPFRALAEECGLQTDIAAVFDNVRKFLENVLIGGMEQ